MFVQGEFTLCARIDSELHVALQPTDSRLAFPCWDEPAVKATFDITLVVPKDRVALSNMVCVVYVICICCIVDDDFSMVG